MHMARPRPVSLFTLNDAQQRRLERQGLSPDAIDAAVLAALRQARGN